MPAPVERSASGARRLAAAATGLYVTWYLGGLLVLSWDPAVFNRWHRTFDGFGPRLVLALVGIGVLGHATGGAARAIADLWPTAARHRASMEAAGRFVTLAAGLPAAAAVVWPAVRAWWLR
jgi:succinate dehydrogenase hydrophobic anchor subunit